MEAAFPQTATPAPPAAVAPLPATLPMPAVQDNAFRICGIPATASAAELHDAAASIRRDLRLSSARASDWDFPWLGPVERTVGSLQQATGHLANVEQRLVERVFWFGPTAAKAAHSIQLL